MSVRHLEWATIQGGLELNLQKRNQRGEDAVFRSQLPCCSSSNYTLNSQISSVPRTVFVFVSCEERLLLCRHGRTAPFWLPLLLRTQPPYARVGIHVWKLKKNISLFSSTLLSFFSCSSLSLSFLSIAMCDFNEFRSREIIEHMGDLVQRIDTVFYKLQSYIIFMKKSVFNNIWTT